jgi:hypothetical protein
MTLMAWVSPSAIAGRWRTVLFKEGGAGSMDYSLYAGDDGAKPIGQVYIGGEQNAVGTATLPLGTWSHLAVTYDGAVLRLYVNGTQVGTKSIAGQITPTTGALRIGGNNIWPEWFQGLVDEVRIYGRALSQTEIQSDMNTPVGPPAPPDTTPPSAPTGLAATTAVGRANLSWNAATDNVGVHHYNVHRSTTANFTPTTANRIAQPTTNSYVDSGLAGGTYYYRVTAEDAAGNVGGSSNEVTAVVPTDQPPTVSITAPTGGATVSGTVDVNANASDDVAVLGVQFLLDGSPLGAEDTAAPFSVPWLTTTVANGTHRLTAVARDGGGHTTTSAFVDVNVNNAPGPPATGLVAAYSFNTISGSSVADVSGNNNGGTVSGPVATVAGKYGGALTFDGLNDWVTVADSNSLDLTTGMTLMAWVNPAAISASWRTVLFKEGGPGSMDYSLYAAEDTAKPIGQVYIGGEQNAIGTATLPLGTWSHLAVTYDGAVLRLYVNGTQVGTKSIAGQITPTTGVLRIGGNNIWPEWFNGSIDEVRVFNRALTQGEIQTNMNTALTP